MRSYIANHVLAGKKTFDEEVELKYIEDNSGFTSHESEEKSTVNVCLSKKLISSGDNDLIKIYSHKKDNIVFIQKDKLIDNEANNYVILSIAGDDEFIASDGQVMAIDNYSEYFSDQVNFSMKSTNLKEIETRADMYRRANSYDSSYSKYFNVNKKSIASALAKATKDNDIEIEKAIDDFYEGKDFING